MPAYWVNYDLNKSGQNYDSLITYLKSHESWAKPLESSFFVTTSLTTAQLRDGIANHIDANDSVVVVNVSGDSWATRGVSANVNNWIRDHL